MTRYPASPRLVFLLDTVYREGVHLRYTRDRLLPTPVDSGWVGALEDDPERAERLDAFVARYGRMQDTIGDRLVPSLLRDLLETPGAALDNLNRMEKLGLLSSVADWIEARNLRNRLVHEYMRDIEEFAAAINRARSCVDLLITTYNHIRDYTAQHLVPPEGHTWPERLNL
ncbi:hypothetical protein [Halorhodospira neutriphila]|uniref:DUF86 domain-containing protein n=1 Tax=Halorhodospira neutriphila TaxID=168379 RepID=A0ABS1E5Y1_9GAMM|nr:hypothetical protein [Halorhodospira neutriphila]MBK1727080.1 hypothetical protein [Halorhodospira neutriphila]